MYRVYDDRTNETLFTNEESLYCVQFIQSHYDMESGEASHIWIEQVADFDYKVNI